MYPCRPDRLLAPLALCCTLMVTASAASAAPSVATNAAPGGFVTACGGVSGTTGGAAPGSDLEAFYLLGFSCSTETFVVGPTPLNSSSWASSGPVTNSAQGQVGFGYMHLAAQSSAPNDASFPYGSANAGWEDNWLLDAPGFNGQAGTVQVSMHVDGTWVLSGFAGAARITVQPYVDDARIDIAGTTEQATFDSSFFPTGVSQTVQFTLPFVFGESFDVGMFALLRAGLRSQSAVPGISTADADFTNTLTWEGIDGVFVGETPVTDYSLVSASGVDWRLPVAAIPEAPIWLAMLAGLGVLAGKMRRKGAAAATA